MTSGFISIQFYDKPLFVGSDWVDSLISDDNKFTGGSLVLVFKAKSGRSVTSQLRILKSENEETWSDIIAIVVSLHDWLKYEEELTK